MSEPTLLSIIVPAYDLGICIEMAAQSVLSQLFQNYEMIIVNDGSNDDTGERCQAIAASAPEKVRYISIPHSGVSAARNAGLKAAVGQYVMFIDGDDCIYPGLLDGVSEILDREQPDLLYFDFKREKYGEYVSSDPVAGTEYRIESHEQTVKKKLMNETIPCYAACYKTGLLKVNSVLFDTEQFYVEDALFFFQALSLSEKIIYFPVTGYCYNQRDGSATHLPGCRMEEVENQRLGWSKIGKYMPDEAEIHKLYGQWKRKTAAACMKRKIRNMFIRACK